MLGAIAGDIIGTVGSKWWLTSARDLAVFSPEPTATAKFMTSAILTTSGSPSPLAPG